MMAYKHKEAFALMWYACPCGHRERIWNSRDGVTPFGGVRCPSCNSTHRVPMSVPFGEVQFARTYAPGMSHVDFPLDTPAPDHKLALGQRFWRDGTREEAVAILERRFAMFEAGKRTVPDEVREGMLNDARNGIGDEFRPGWPYLDRHPDR